MAPVVPTSRATGGRATVVDVAARAGVSASTVSNALRHPERLRPRVLARVLAAVDETGYSPNLAARTVRGSDLRVVGFVGDLRDRTVRAAAVEVERSVLQAGYELQIARLDPWTLSERLVVLGAVGVRAVVVDRARCPNIADRSALATRRAARSAVRVLLGESRCGAHPDATRTVEIGIPTVVCDACDQSG